MAERDARIDRLLLGQEIADFLYREAELLDERRYREWLDLLADDVRYWMPMRPSLSRKATRSSPMRRTRTGGQSASAISLDRQAGIQYRRIALPIGVAGPVRVISSFSSFESMRVLLG